MWEDISSHHKAQAHELCLIIYVAVNTYYFYSFTYRLIFPLCVLGWVKILVYDGVVVVVNSNAVVDIRVVTDFLGDL